MELTIGVNVICGGKKQIIVAMKPSVRINKEKGVERDLKDLKRKRE